jgi:hypothetical protein
MALTITGQVICGTSTRHLAIATGGTGWAVTWLPGRTLTRSRAITAMLLAEATQAPIPGHARQHVEAWAAELGLTGDVAAILATQGPDGAAGKSDKGMLTWAVPRPR